MLLSSIFARFLMKAVVSCLVPMGFQSMGVMYIVAPSTHLLSFCTSLPAGSRKDITKKDDLYLAVQANWEGDQPRHDEKAHDPTP